MAAGMLYPGRVVGIDVGGPRVVVPQLGGSAEYGPLPTTVPDLAVNDSVVVTSLGSSRDQLIVLGRMTGRAPTMDEIPGLDARLDADEARISATEAKNTQQDGRLTAAEGTNTTQDGRLTTVEGRAGAVEGRATSLENRTTAVEGVNATQTTNITANGTAITTLRADTAGKVTTKGDLLIATASGVLARHAAPANGLLLVPDSTAPDGWSSKDVLGMPKALTGAVAPTRYVGATTGGPPVTGTWLVGDFALDTVTGDVWTCTTAGTDAAAGWTSPSGRTRHGRLTADQPLTNTQTFAAIGGCSFSVEAGAEYVIEGLLLYNALAAADIKFGLAGPAMTSFYWTLFGAITTMTATDATTTQAAVEMYAATTPDAIGTTAGGRGLGANGNVNMAAQPKGHFIPSAAGTVTLVGAQLTLSTTASTVRRGTWLRCTRIA